MKHKSNRGFTGIDITIALIIISFFISIISTLFYNIYLTNSEVVRNNMANKYAIDILEKIELLNYGEVEIKRSNSTTLISELNNLLNEEPDEKEDNLVTYTKNGYTINLSIIKYNETYKESEDSTDENKIYEYDNRDKQDYIKIVTVDVKYNLGENKNNNERSVKISTLKTF